MSIALDIFCFDIPITMLFAALLFVATDVGGGWWPISARVVLMDVTFWKFSNNPPNSTFMADAITFIIMLHSTYAGPFYDGISCIGVYFWS